MNHVDPLWYKDAVIYQLHVRAFFDANDDGIGDFAGLTQKLDYLQDLGVTAIWLLPFYPSPLKDDGYDIADYRNVHPHYGSLRDFKTFLRAAHHRGLKVITELVINHTSDQHPWFQRSRRAPEGSRWRDYYVWSRNNQKYREARIIFQDFESSNWSWDPVARAYYWHRFYHHQPDLNFDNPEVQRAVLQILDHWLQMGVDGLRLDAVPYLFEREGTNCENLPETHAFLKKLRAHVDAHFQGRMLLAEANQWPEDAAAYFGQGDECHAAFHFPLMPRLYLAVQREDRFPIIVILQQTPEIPETCQWMLFLRNHDELTLEMVTDEERDDMYRTYGRDPRARINLGIRRRLAPLMENNRRKIELLNGLLLSLPGTPIIYYGDEIGMGDNIYLGDRNGVRTPMQWSADRNAGFSRTNPQQLYLPPIIDYEYHYESLNVETQQGNPHSLLAWMRRLLSLRQHSPALAHGTLEFLYPRNPKVLAYLRKAGSETVLVVANLSRFAQFVELDLSAFQGCTPVELFGRIEFPPIGELPYLLTLTPHSFFWFAVRSPALLAHEGPVAINELAGHEPELVTLEVSGFWDRVFQGGTRARLEKLLPAYLATRPWFDGRGKVIASAVIADVVLLPIGGRRPDACFLLIELEFTDAPSERHLLPLAFGSEERLQYTQWPAEEAVLARLDVERGGRHESGVLYDAFGDEDFAWFLLDLIASRRSFPGHKGRVQGRPSRAFRRLRGQDEEPAVPEEEPAWQPVEEEMEHAQRLSAAAQWGFPSQWDVRVIKEDQSNSAVCFGQRMLLKLYRRLEEGVHPELETGQFLTDVVAFSHVPPVAGVIEYRSGHNPLVTLALLEGFIPHESTGWDHALGHLANYFDLVHAEESAEPPPEEDTPRPLTEAAAAEPPPTAYRLFEDFLRSAGLLGRRTAELHAALAAAADHPTLAPAPFTRLYQRSVYQAVRNRVGRTFRALQNRLSDMAPPIRSDAEEALAHRDDLLDRLSGVLTRPIEALRIRCHGDFRLEEVLFTGQDFVIIDMEGEPVRPQGARPVKASALRDVAGMLHSFEYAAYWALAEQLAGVVVDPAAAAQRERWARFWIGWTGSAYLGAYLDAAGDAPFLPGRREDIETLLNVYLVETTLVRLTADLRERPDRIWIALRQLARWWREE